MRLPMLLPISGTRPAALGRTMGDFDGRRQVGGGRFAKWRAQPTHAYPPIPPERTTTSTG
jgi:hypothetical protein